MKSVSRFEAGLLHILDCLLGRGPLEQALPLILRDQPEPRGLGRDAVRLIEDRLAKGCVRRLARLGWRRERFLRGNAGVTGRLWERTPPAELGLHFGGHSLRFLIWLTAHRPGKGGWSPPSAELTLGDRLLLYLAYEALRDTDVAAALRARPVFDEHGLVRLSFPGDFDLRQASPAPDFAPWLSGTGAAVLECLQPELRQRWRRMEDSKKTMTNAAALRRLGHGQEVVLECFLEAVAAVNRLDLARFLLEVAEELLTPAAGRHTWFHEEIQAGLTLAERRQTYRAGLALVRQLPRFQKYALQARGIGYFDDGYAAAQLFKEDWESRHGERSAARARAILQEMEPLA